MKTAGLVVAASLLVACGSEKAASEGSGTVVAAQAFADIQIAAPEHWTKTYRLEADAWQLVSGDGAQTVRIDRADERYVASPDAFMQHLEPTWGKDKLVTIEDRQLTGSAGFTVRLAIFNGQGDAHPRRATYVVRRLGKIWYRCYGEGLEDEALRNEVIAMCRSVRQP